MAIMPFVAPAPVAPSVRELIDYIERPVNRSDVPCEEWLYCPNIECGSGRSVYPAMHGRDQVPGLLCCIACDNTWPVENSASFV